MGLPLNATASIAASRLTIAPALSNARSLRYQSGAMLDRSRRSTTYITPNINTRTPRAVNGGAISANHATSAGTTLTPSRRRSADSPSTVRNASPQCTAPMNERMIAAYNNSTPKISACHPVGANHSPMAAATNGISPPAPSHRAGAGIESGAPKS